MIIMSNKFNAYCWIEPVKEYTAEDKKRYAKKQEPHKGSWPSGLECQ